MDKPECRLCGAKHWSNEPHAFESAAKPKPARKDSSESPKKKSKLSQVERNRRWREKNREKYTASQRELMRARRAEKKNE